MAVTRLCVCFVALAIAGQQGPAAAGAAQPPSAEQITEWLELSRPCPIEDSGFFNGADFKPNHVYRQLGDLRWINFYSNTACSPIHVSVALYTGATHLTPERADKIAKRVEALKKKSPDESESPEESLLRPRIFDLDQGRKGYHFLLIFGPGGAMTGTSLTSRDGRFDLAVLLFYASEDDTSEDQRMTNPAVPQADPPALLKSVEAEVFR